MKPAALLAPLSKSLFFLATGRWPVLHVRRTPAPARGGAWRAPARAPDRALVADAVAGVIAAAGTAVAAGLLARKPRALRLLGIGGAIALGVADLVVTFRAATRGVGPPPGQGDRRLPRLW